jgi:hypothetical protein
LNAPNKSKGIIASNVHANIVIIVCWTALVIASVNAVAAVVVPHNPSTHTTAINSKMIRDKTSATISTCLHSRVRASASADASALYG